MFCAFKEFRPTIANMPIIAARIGMIKTIVFSVFRHQDSVLAMAAASFSVISLSLVVTDVTYSSSVSSWSKSDPEGLLYFLPFLYIDLSNILFVLYL